jgi:cysteine desulfurase
MKKHIYFDHSATTPVDPEVLKTILPYFTEDYGNPASIHYFGQMAMKAVEKANSQAGNFFGAKPDELVYTSGATEANNLAIIGVAKALEKKYPKQKLHIITSMIEHDSVLESVAAVQKLGHSATHVSVDRRGVINLEELKAAILPETMMVSIMYVNSEVGSIQPIQKIGKFIKKINEQRLRDWHNSDPKVRVERPTPILLHTDATQAINFLPCKVNELGVDLLSMSAHKIYGPKGVGLLYIRTGTPIIALQVGGHHQGNRRSGTLNTPGIVGLGKALEKLTPEYQAKQNKKIAVVRDYLVKSILSGVPEVILNTDREISSPAHAHFSFLGVEGESILIALDLAGVAVSTGSACASSSLKASHVVVAMGIKVEVAHSSIRFTLGKASSRGDVDYLMSVLPKTIERLRSFNPLYKK